MIMVVVAGGTWTFLARVLMMLSGTVREARCDVFYVVDEASDA